MKFKIRPCPFHVMQFTFDKEVREIFAEATDLACRFTRNPQVRRSASNVMGSPLDDWEVGLFALERLAFVPSKSIHLQAKEVRAALHLVSATTFFQIDHKGALDCLIEVLPWLARGSICRIKCGKLPRAETVWRLNMIPEVLRDAYELFRSETEGYFEVSVLAADWLYEAMEEDVALPQLEQLKGQLATGSTPYRQAMRMALRARSRQRHRRKSAEETSG